MIRKMLRAYTEALREQDESKKHARDFAERLNDVRARCYGATVADCSHQPIFLMASSWRSGSTLLQRMMMAGCDQLLMWGEPFDRSNIFESLRNQLRPFTREWPPDKYFFDHTRSSLHEEWIANLYPDVECLRKAHINFLLTLFCEPAKAVGRQRWGVKEVRLGVDDAAYLKWLFPEAKFVFLCRNPLAAYASYRRFGKWYSYWPDSKVVTPTQFGRHWRTLTADFMARHRDVDGVFIKYEDLRSSSAVAEINAYLGFDLVLADELRRLDGKSDAPRPTAADLPFVEKALLKAALGHSADMAGYRL